MPELKPTMGRAWINREGSCCFAAVDNPAIAEPGGVSSVRCLIMPAPRPIEEAPKDGSGILAFDQVTNQWSACHWHKDRWSDGTYDEAMMSYVPVLFKWWLPMLPNPEDANG